MDNMEEESLKISYDNIFLPFFFFLVDVYFFITLVALNSFVGFKKL